MLSISVKMFNFIFIFLFIMKLDLGVANTAADDSKILGELPFLESIIWNFAGVSKLLALGGQYRAVCCQFSVQAGK